MCLSWLAETFKVRAPGPPMCEEYDPLHLLPSLPPGFPTGAHLFTLAPGRKASEEVLKQSHNGRFKPPPKSHFFFFLLLLLLAKRICVWSMYQTSLSPSLSGTKSPLTLLLSKSSVLPLAAWLMTFILMEMEEEEKALDADLDTHIHLRRKLVGYFYVMQAQ